jgi:IS5 family transposase
MTINKGRAGLPTRLMAGLHLLKHMKGLSDEQVCAVWLENPYFQAFCGADYFQHERPFDRASMTRWRQRIGAKALVVRFRHLAPIAACPRPNVGIARTTRNDKVRVAFLNVTFVRRNCGIGDTNVKFTPRAALLAETVAVAAKTEVVSSRQLARVTVDTTVQTKAIAHPSDSHLMVRAIAWLNRAAQKHGYRTAPVFHASSSMHLAPRARKAAARLMHTGGHKQGLRWVRKLRTWPGRLIRDSERKIVQDCQ